MSSSNVKLKKVTLGPDWIDLSFGEPKVVMSAAIKQLNRMGSSFSMPTSSNMCDWGYQEAAGKPDFVSLLENKYKAKVVVCNGAKQALAGAAYSLRRSGYSSIYYPDPYYPANPSIIELAGLTRCDKDSAASYLFTSPNNPDGKVLTPKEIVHHGKPVIHDAAYYTDVYMPEGEQLYPLGDIQIFSFSKMYGFSGLRIGYAVCYNNKYYDDIVTYVETSSAGVSTASQDVARSIEEFFINNPASYEEFVKDSRAALMASRQELWRLDPDVLQMMACDSNSMFAWCKAGPALDYKTAKVNILPGDIFGMPGMMRINLANPSHIVREAVDRLNKHKI